MDNSNKGNESMKRIPVDLWRSFNLQIKGHQNIVSFMHMVLLNDG